jgi:hypothetical protein
VSEEIAASIGDVLAENARLKQQLAQAEERARIASEAYHQQQDAQREHEARYQAAVERAQVAEQHAARYWAALRRFARAWRVEWQSAREWHEAWLRDGAAIERLQDALQGLLDDPHGCPLCDCGTPRNPEKGHWPECPYEPARAVLAAERARNR